MQMLSTISQRFLGVLLAWVVSSYAISSTDIVQKLVSSSTSVSGSPTSATEPLNAIALPPPVSSYGSGVTSAFSACINPLDPTCYTDTVHPPTTGAPLTSISVSISLEHPPTVSPSLLTTSVPPILSSPPVSSPLFTSTSSGDSLTSLKSPSSTVPSIPTQSEVSGQHATSQSTQTWETVPFSSSDVAYSYWTTSVVSSSTNATQVSSNAATSSTHKGTRPWVVIVAIICVLIVIILLGLVVRAMRARRVKNLSDFPVSPFDPEFMKDPSMLAEPFVTGLATRDGPMQSFSSVTHPRNHSLISPPEARPHVHQLQFVTDSLNAAEHPLPASPSCVSPESQIAPMKLRLFGDAASDASSRNSRNEASGLRGGASQRCSAAPSHGNTLPLPHDLSPPRSHEAASQAHIIPEALIPGQMSRFSTPLAFRASKVSFIGGLPQPASQPSRPSLAPPPAHTRNTPWAPDPSWGYVKGPGASS